MKSFGVTADSCAISLGAPGVANLQGKKVGDQAGVPFGVQIRSKRNTIKLVFSECRSEQWKHCGICAIGDPFEVEKLFHYIRSDLFSQYYFCDCFDSLIQKAFVAFQPEPPPSSNSPK